MMKFAKLNPELTGKDKTNDKLNKQILCHHSH